MATITTDTFLDGGTARSAGETWTINGATFTIRTDTRWHANAPASMTGTIGQVSIDSTQNGGFVIDARNVRWLQFNTTSDTVPAIGTTITQGPVSGYLLGVWPDLNSAPLLPGAAMPTSGYIKFREVSGGNFVSGALTGISASATGADVAGWIEVAVDQGSNLMTGGSALSSFDTYGDWFYLDSTTGTAGQVIQTPTNGGGAATFVQAVQIETAAGSGVYEWYPAIATSYWTTSVLNTDSRSKFVQSLGTGQIRIGSNGTSNIGYTPPAGCKVRMPNVIFRQATSAARATNVASTTLTTRARINSGTAKRLNLNFITGDIYITVAGTLEVSFTNSAYDSQVTVTGVLSSTAFTNCANGFPQVIGSTGLSITTNYTPTSFSNCKFIVVTNTPVINISDVSLVSANELELCGVFARVSAYRPLTLFQVTTSTFSRLKLRNGGVQTTTCADIRFTDVDYIDRLSGNTDAGSANIAIYFSSSTNITLDGFTFGAGTLDFTNCYDTIFYTNQCRRIKIRNGGTLTSPLLCGNNSSSYPNRIHASTGAEEDIWVQRIYCSGTRSPIVWPAASSYRQKYEHLSGNFGVNNTIGYDYVCRGTTADKPNGNIYAAGSSFIDGFTSATAGFIQFAFTPPSVASSAFTTLSVANARSGFDGKAQILLKTVGDYVILESPYWVKGHTAFANTALILTPGTYLSNFTIQYSLDTGSGFGAYKTLNLTNLTGETISPTGFRMRLKVQCTTANNSNALQYVGIATTTNNTARMNNLYPLDTVTQSFTGLIPGSEVRCYTGTDPATAVEIGGTEATAGSTFSFTHSSAGVAGTIVILAMGYQPIYLPYTYTSTDNSILIQPVVDRNYVNPV